MVGQNEIEMKTLSYSTKHIMIASGRRAQRPNVLGHELGITSNDEVRVVVAKNLEGMGIILQTNDDIKVTMDQCHELVADVLFATRPSI
ncbi:unnamed protein product [Lupinus luteus]|uniref:Uncharacterized protein n=1 Tax=Lupinus luteus TaxID=3873 RepID=A0AAV1VX90_LUPLU